MKKRLALFMAAAMLAVTPCGYSMASENEAEVEDAVIISDEIVDVIEETETTLTASEDGELAVIFEEESETEETESVNQENEGISIVSIEEEESASPQMVADSTVTELEVNTTYAASDVCVTQQYSFSGEVQYFSVPSPGRIYLKLENCVNPDYSVNHYSYTSMRGTNIQITNGQESAASNYIVLSAAGQYSFQLVAGNAINSEATFCIVYEAEDSYNGESTENDSFATATEINTNNEYWGMGDYYNDSGYYSSTYTKEYIDYDYYHFTLESPAQVSISLKDTDFVNYREAILYCADSSGETAICSQSYSAVTDGSSFDNLRLPAGSYYIRVYSSGSYINRGDNSQYYLTVSSADLSSDTGEIEKNDLSSQANEINTNKTYTGNINLYDSSYGTDYDWYKFTVSEKCYLTVTLGKENWTTGSVTANLYSVDAGGQLEEVTDIEISTGTAISSDKLFASPGTYYVRMSGTASWDYTLNVQQEEYIALTAITLPESKSIGLGGSDYLVPTFTPSNASEQGITWTSSNTKVATVDENGKVTAVASGKATITAASSFADSSTVKATCAVNVTSDVKIKLSSLTNKSSGIRLEWDKVSSAEGYYVYRKTGSGSYKLIKTIKTASTTGYTDKTVKNGTTYTYKVVPYSDYIKGSGTGKKITRVVGTKLSSVKKASSTKITVKWKKASKASGYQIQYSTSKTFASGNKTKKVSGGSKKSVSISGLKSGTTYYVRIRAYKKVFGKTYYSAWSTKKSVKTSGSSSTFNKYWYTKYTYKSSSGTIMTFSWLDSGDFGIEFSGVSYGAYDFNVSSYTKTSDGYYFYDAGTYGIKYDASKNAVLFIPGVGGSTWYYAR
ncbi:MAG: Ig-like domain-containing protein [Lachnospiraceae bacterium]|nr:Ig-like domain-containing protein [Lachnospiraceae bacterium]